MTATILKLDCAQKNAQWQTIGKSLHKPMSMVGLQQINEDSILVFGGFDTANAVSNELTMLVDKGNDEFSIRVFKDKDEATGQESRATLKNADKFLLNGVAVHDPNAQELIVSG